MALVHSPYPHANIKGIDSERSDGGFRERWPSSPPRNSRPTEVGWLPTFHGARQADGTGGGQGSLPVPGGRRLLRRDPRGRLRHGRAGRGGLRAARGGQQPVQSHEGRRCCCARTAKPRPTTSTTGTWATQGGTDAALAASDHVVREHITYPSASTLRRSSRAAALPSSTRWDGSSFTSPRRPRTSTAPRCFMVLGIPEDKIRVISPDLGGGFGNKVPVYPGYICAIAGRAGAGATRQMD